MRALEAKGMKDLILDLRYNTGGPFFQSIEISDQFLPKDSVIVSIKGRNKIYNKEFRAWRDNQYEGIPLVVLINRGSASASEIVSGAIMDNDRGFIVGEDSWGKGLVQTVFPLGENLAVALTTAKYLTPSGRSIQRDYEHIEDYMLYRQAPEDSREIRYTAKGRKVLGQGGITPDFEIGWTPPSPLTSELNFKGAFFGYARKLTGGATALGETASIGRSFAVDSRVVEDFLAYLRANKIAFEEGKFKEAEGEIRRELERAIYSSALGSEEGWKAYQKSDEVILKALEIMPEAAKFVASKKTP
jgi:carboxyl-terminal processing protease